MRVLVIDTCLAACQVGVFDDGRMVAGASEAMERGHQERLAPMARQVLTEAGGYDRIAVTTGPGSFTGLRVGLAFAKGLGLATGKPLVGLGTLAGLAASVAADGPVAGVVDARRGQVYLQAFDGARALNEPDVLPLAEAAARLQALGQGPFVLAGSGAQALAALLPGARAASLAAPDLAALGRLARAAEVLGDVRPLYLRAPDARPMPA
ncbi:MAG TPA: tRNA (adenosine(37)-N6)-threonylcarbamoyltransferase complex dimerization subunit type 1 TsaB [Caulobacteraceae bacterium]|nr:tRNA (adenosine(37)-N6)-threonylcarbamoyltransferase complex dimerization subunit type 1 TsaB [Caulobacteraceae bacterium]